MFKMVMSTTAISETTDNRIPRAVGEGLSRLDDGGVMHVNLGHRWSAGVFSQIIGLSTDYTTIDTRLLDMSMVHGD
jgi:hypothetical protein